MTTSELQILLAGLSTPAMKELANQSGVSLRNLWKIRGGVTKTASEQTKEKVEPILNPRKRKGSQ